MAFRPESSRENNFNALRLLFATLVLLSHSFELIDGDRSREPLTRLFGTMTFGEVAVDSFFLLSGYLITQSWIHSDGAIDYIRKRVLRIYPGFVVAAAISVLAVGPIARAATNYFSELNFTQFATELMLLLVPKTPPVFAGNPYPDVNGAMWSITYEFRCYLLVPLLGAIGLFRKRKILISVVAVVLALYLASELPYLHEMSYWTNLSFLRLVSYFMIGSCFYIFRDYILYSGRWATLIAFCLCASMFSKILAGPAYALLGGYLLFYAAFKGVRALRFFGSADDISYGVYLYGWPIQKIVIWQLPSLHPLVVFLISVLCSYAAGYMSWKIIEKPFLRFKGRRIPKLALTPLVRDAGSTISKCDSGPQRRG